MNEYVIAFSSFYRAMYAQEKLQENRIGADLRKIPPNVLKSVVMPFIQTIHCTCLESSGSSQITPRGACSENRDGSLTYRNSMIL